MTFAVRAIAVTMIVAGVYMALSSPQAHAALPVSSINTCGSAIAAMNAGLTTVARSRVALKVANKSHKPAAINRAKKRLAAAEAQRDAVRAKIKSLCGAGVVTAQAGGCSQSIDKLAAIVEQLAGARAQLATLLAAKPGTKNLKTARRALEAKIRKLEKQADTLTDAMQAACNPASHKATTDESIVAPPIVVPDTTGPTVTIVANSSTNDSSPHVELSANEPGVTYQCGLDGAPSSVTSPAFDLPILSEATHALSCSGTDAAGNVGAVTSKSITVDLTAPNAPLVAGTTLTQTTHLSFGVSPYDPGDVASCKVDAGTYAVAPNYQFTHDFTVGVHHVICVMADVAGNTSPATDLLVTILP